MNALGGPGSSPSQILPSRISDEDASVHVMSRAVFRCFLLGDDPVTGMNRLCRGKTAECYSVPFDTFLAWHALFSLLVSRPASQ